MSSRLLGNTDHSVVFITECTKLEYVCTAKEAFLLFLLLLFLASFSHSDITTTERKKKNHEKFQKVKAYLPFDVRPGEQMRLEFLNVDGENWCHGSWKD